MVYLAVSPQGLRAILEAPEAAAMHVWCSADALSEEDLEKLERVRITRFNYSLLHADKEEIQDAISTIEEHHPNERIWVESVVFGE